jgi:hypothetical protein
LDSWNIPCRLRFRLGFRLDLRLIRDGLGLVIGKLGPSLVMLRFRLFLSFSLGLGLGLGLLLGLRLVLNLGFCLGLILGLVLSLKRFQGPAMRIIDFSHRKTPIRLFW